MTAFDRAAAVYDSAASVFQELSAHGVERVLVSPGSRSTPLAIAANRVESVEVDIHIDERSAAFWALGIAKATRRPVALVCTSGTAAANYLPAVIEAHFSEVPLIVLTADRPPELRDRGAGQTIDQLAIYGSHVRWWSDLPVAGEAAVDWFRSTAARATRVATGPRPGPVHLNWPFREPLEPPAQWAPPPVRSPIALERPAGATPSSVLDEAVDSPRGLILAGPMHADHVDDVLDFARRTGWPLIAEPLSQCRVPAAGVVTTAHHDHVLRTEWAARHLPDVVVRVGQPMTCKPLRLWLERHRPQHILVDPGDSWTDASVTVTDVVTADPSVLRSVKIDRGPGDWSEAWRIADEAARLAVDEILDKGPLLEAGIARELGRALPDHHTLYVSNSMPVRDVDSFLRPREALACFGNRGASGIDGVISAAAGVASTGQPTTLYIGDLAALHDISGLLSAVEHDVDLTMVVADNAGGGIFSFLPIAGEPGIAFETLFRTPQRHDLGALAAACGADHVRVERLEELGETLSTHVSGVRLVVVEVDRDANVAQHAEIASAVAARVTEL